MMKPILLSGNRISGVLLTAALLLGPAAISHAQSAENVAVVINEASPDSKRVGEYYVQKRKVPASNVIRIQTELNEEIGRPVYTRTIEQPIASALRREGLHDRVLYLVLTKGIPLRVTGTEGRTGSSASVDSELTLLYRLLTGRQVALTGSVPNPYSLGVRSIREAQPFTHRTYDIFLVARLDGFSVEDVLALIDRAQQPRAAAGRIVLDQRGGLSDATGDGWLADAAARLRDLGHGPNVVLEDTTRAARNVDDVVGYYSWGSNDPQNRERRVNMRFVPGALASTFVSNGARTFQTPPENWLPSSDSSDKNQWFAGSPQSLAGDLIREGVTGVAASVAEPYFDGAVRPQILFPAYLAGFNLVESFYLALPFLSWQTVVIGDPLCAPFRKTVLTRAEIEEPMSPETEVPAIFSKWRMDVARLLMKDVPPEALALTVRAEARMARGDRKAAREPLEEATKIAPAAGAAQLQLATLYEEAGEWTQAVERYRQVLKLQQNNVIALNNLAYLLAVRRNAPEEGLSFARRAVALAPNNASVVDTAAWIEHLLGNHKEAAKLLLPLVQKGATNPETHLHAAIIAAAVGDNAVAERQLGEALRLDPKLAAQDDVKALRAQLGGKLKPL